MSLRLPLTGTATRDLIDTRHLAEIASPANRMKLPTFREALAAAKRTMSADKAIRAVHTYCLRANGELWLVRVGPRGGWKKQWNFGAL